MRVGPTEGVAFLGARVGRFGRYLDDSLGDLAGPVVKGVLADSGLTSDDIDMAFVANVVGAVTVGQVSVIGQSMLASCGIGGIPVFNVDNACAASSSALSLAGHAVLSGAAQRVLVVGAEKMLHPDKGTVFRALNGAADRDWVTSTGIDTSRQSVFVTEVYPGRLARYAAEHDLDAKTLARISVKNRGHAAANPNAQFRDPLTVEEVLEARTVVEPLTTLMCSPPGDGVAAAVVTTPEAARKADRRPVWLRASEVSMGSANGGSIRRVAERALDEAGVGPDDLDVCELHDATAFSELQAYEEIGLCRPGGGSRLVVEGATTLGGRIPVNTSGGLESRGHPLAATGLAQVAELVAQLRGEAGDRQVPHARVALAESAGGFVNGDSAAVAVTVLARD